MWVGALVDRRLVEVQWLLAASSARPRTACAVHSRLGPGAGWEWLRLGLEAWWVWGPGQLSSQVLRCCLLESLGGKLTEGLVAGLLVGQVQLPGLLAGH